MTIKKLTTCEVNNNYTNQTKIKNIEEVVSCGDRKRREKRKNKKTR